MKSCKRRSLHRNLESYNVYRPWSVDKLTESFKNALMSPGGGINWMPCHMEAKVSLLVVSLFSLKTMSIRALLRTSNIRFSFRNCSIPKVVIWQSTWFSKHKRADVRRFVSLLDVVFTELISICRLFILSISTVDIVRTGNADNKSLVYIFSLV